MTTNPTTAAGAVQPVPDGYGTVTPWIISRDTARLLDFLKKAFGAEETGRVLNEDGVTVGHAEARIGDSVVLMFDAQPEWPDTPAFLRLYLAGVDAVFEQALRAGATPVTALVTHMFGDRGGRVRDPLGNIWWLTQHIEDVSPDEVMRRVDEWQHGQRSDDAEAMREAQASLDHELRRRNRA